MNIVLLIHFSELQLFKQTKYILIPTLLYSYTHMFRTLIVKWIRIHNMVVEYMYDRLKNYSVTSYMSYYNLQRTKIFSNKIEK
jgi:hypothetical protein